MKARIIKLKKSSFKKEKRVRVVNFCQSSDIKPIMVVIRNYNGYN